MTEIAISDAEWQVINVIWDGQPMTSQEIVAELSATTNWAPATVKTMLHRLTKKEVLTFDQQGNRYVYRARVRRSDCVRRECRSFVRKVFSGETSSLLAHFLKSSKLTAEEIQDLRNILDEQEAQS